jgi:hypothetical protein
MLHIDSCRKNLLFSLKWFNVYLYILTFFIIYKNNSNNSHLGPLEGINQVFWHNLNELNMLEGI